LECGERLKQIQTLFDENHIDDGQMRMITSETKRKCEELTKNIQVSVLCLNSDFTNII
jgi:hypothetical protein